MAFFLETQAALYAYLLYSSFHSFTIQTRWISFNSIQNNVANLQIRKQKSKGNSKPQGFIPPQIHTLYPN